MKKSFSLAGSISVFLLLFYSPGWAAPDSRDSIIVESKTANPGTGQPIVSVRIYITNKDSLEGFSLSLVEKSATGGAYLTLSWPRNDTGVVHRLTNTLKGSTIFAGNRYNGTSPDTFMVGSFYEPGNLATVEPPNATRKAFFEIKFDTVRSNAGTVELDSAFVATGVSEVSTSFIDMQVQTVPVNFVKGTITVPDVISPTVTVTDPNGGEYVSKSPCPPYTITWDASDNVSVTGIEIRLDRTNDGIFEQLITSLSGNPGSYEWAPSGSNSTHAKIKVIATDAAGNSGSDVSDNTFTIGQYCIAKAVVRSDFDINKDGVVTISDAIELVDCIYQHSTECETLFMPFDIKILLNMIFSKNIE